MTQKQPNDAATDAAIQKVKRSNDSFISLCLSHLFVPGVLPEVFAASHVTREALRRGWVPTDWRAVGPLVVRAMALGLIEPVGFALRAKGPLAHVSNHYCPTYRLLPR